MARKTVAAKRAETERAFPRTVESGARMLNVYDLVKEYARATGRPVPPYLRYRRQIPGRGYQSAAWQVVRPGLKTDPEAHWRDRSHKTFSVYAQADRAALLEEAKAWASERYGVTEWAQTDRLLGGRPGEVRDWVPKPVVDWLEAEIARRLKEES